MSETQDRREQILTRLQEVFVTLAGDADKVFRNQLSIPETARPGFVIWDGDEVAEEIDVDDPRPRGRSNARSPLVVTMTPEIFVAIGGPADSVGTTLNDLRKQILKAVLQDDSLKNLAKDGAITYDQMSTNLAVGRSIEASAKLQFSFEYVIHPADL